MTTMISEVYSAFKTAGVPEQEARQAAEALSAENLATRSIVTEDKSELYANITAVEQKLSGEIAALDQKLSDKITALDQKLSGEIAALDHRLSGEIAKVRQEAAAVEQRLSDKIAALDQKLSGEIGEIKRKMSVIHWMLSFVLIAVVLPLVQEIILFWL